MMGDPIKDVLERQAQDGRDRYGWVLMIGWRDKKLDALQSIPADRLDMLLDNEELFRERDFADCPVNARERNLMVGEMPWAVFVMAARVAADATLNSAAIKDQLRSLAEELGVSKEQATEVEREVLGKTIKKALERQGQYRKAVEEAYMDGQVGKAKANRLTDSKDRLGLNNREAAGIEREVLGDTVAAVLVEQDEVNRLAQRYEISRSRVKGTGKGGRVTRKDMEAAYAKEQKRKEQERKKQEREVPDLDGQSLEQARNNLNAASLKLGDQTEAPSETVAEGAIISQRPAAGTRVRKGNAVSVTVSSGSSIVEVPDLAGLNRYDASNTLATANLEIGTQDEVWNDEVPRGEIMKQSPAAGTTARKGSTVSVTVSSGPSIVEVPNLFGKYRNRADEMRGAANLEVDSMTEASSWIVHEGKIIKQSPEAGTKVASGSSVSLVVSTGPDKSWSKIWNLLGLMGTGIGVVLVALHFLGIMELPIPWWLLLLPPGMLVAWGLLSKINNDQSWYEPLGLALVCGVVFLVMPIEVVLAVLHLLGVIELSTPLWRLLLLPLILLVVWLGGVLIDTGRRR